MKIAALLLSGASIVVLTPALGHASDAALVDCSQAKYKSSTSPRSLLQWSKRHFEAAQRAQTSGTSATRACSELLRQRGGAYCQAPDNAEYRAALLQAQSVCSSPNPADSAPAAAAAAQAPGTAAGHSAPLVDCAEPRFHSSNGAKSLMGWSMSGFRSIEAAKGTGVYPELQCTDVISKRGAAHCKQPTNPKFREGLQAALTLCASLKNPAPAKGKLLVDCKDKRFQRRKAVPVMVKWSLGMSARLEDWEGFRAKARCEEALAFAGSAHCMLPNEQGPRDAIESVKQTCAADKARRHAEAQAAKAADAKRIAANKANRTLTTFPRSTYKGPSNKLAQQMQRAMQSSGIAKSTSEMQKLVPMGTWQEGRYRVTQVPYRKIRGTVLWFDKDDDGVCRFTTYKFVQDKGARGWGKLRFKAFCNGCAEGWTRCK